MTYSLSLRLWLGLGVLVALASLVGCSREPAPSTVTGEIKLDGRPIPMGLVKFYPQAPGASFRIGEIQNGRYTVETLQGVNIIVVETPAAPEDGSNAKLYVTIPDKYSTPDTSDLRVDVTGTNFTHDIALKR